MTLDPTAASVVHLGKLALDFGQVNRMTFHPDGETPESDTTHTVMLGLLACAIAERWFPGLDRGRIAQFALVHDLVEVYAGDTPTLRMQSADAKAEKKHREQAAQDRIYAELHEQLPWVPALIGAYENLDTPEARFVKMLDKLLPKITHLLNGAVTVRREGMTRAELVERYEQQGRDLDRYAAEFPEIEELRRALVAEVLGQLDEQAVTL